MSTKPETRFYTAVHKLLPKELHREKMSNPYRGGTADVWYSGTAADLWAEYKWLTKVPVRANIRVYELLSPLQLQWLGDRRKEGRNVVVILGSPDGAWIYEFGRWGEDLPIDHFIVGRKTKQQVADYIRSRTMTG
jgi:hypothetical protein